MKKSIALLISLILFVNACAQTTDPSIIIIPDKCKIVAGEEFPISLEGSNMPSNGEISWSATKGEINPSTGLNVIYTAPLEPGAVIITALLETEDVKYSTTLICEVTVADLATNEVPPITTLPSTPIRTNNTTIAITEVMAAPCYAATGPSKNEYIELYNYGNNDIDVNEWWIATGDGGAGTPDKITTWDSVNPGFSLGNNVIINSSVIPPNRFAVVLSPLYYTGTGINLMPYIFPKDTIILTLSNSDYLGTDTSGLLGNSTPFSTLVLYVGSESVMDAVISTYGTPAYGSSPKNVVDNNLDIFPFSVPDCHSVERIVASQHDLVTNWREIDLGNPGEGNYP